MEAWTGTRYDVMTLSLLKRCFVKSWIWIREHWQIPLLLVWTIVVYMFARRNTDALLEVVESKRDSYRRQVEVLRRSHNDEILKRDNLTKKYEESLAKIEEEYSKKREELSEIQKNDIKEVIIKSKGNPDEIRKKIEEEFGFKYVE